MGSLPAMPVPSAGQQPSWPLSVAWQRVPGGSKPHRGKLNSFCSAAGFWSPPHRVPALEPVPAVVSAHSPTRGVVCSWLSPEWPLLWHWGESGHHPFSLCGSGVGCPGIRNSDPHSQSRSPLRVNQVFCEPLRSWSGTHVRSFIPEWLGHEMSLHNTSWSCLSFPQRA